MPDLEAAGFRGTFYLTTGDIEVTTRASDWREAHHRGHEIGNHPVHHPARSEFYPSNPSWLTHRMDQYSPEDIRVEIREAANWLNEHFGWDADRSYAYPCCHTSIGIPPDEKSYQDAILLQHRFARGGTILTESRKNGEGVNDPMKVDLMKIGALGYWPTSKPFLLEAINSVRQTGGWLVLIFHGIGGPSHETPRELHQEVINRLGGTDFWIAPVRDVAKHVELHRKSES